MWEYARIEYKNWECNTILLIVQYNFHIYKVSTSIVFTISLLVIFENVYTVLLILESEINSDQIFLHNEQLKSHVNLFRVCR